MAAPAEKVRIVIKKKGGHAAHHGGAWKVAYADFVTAMMALFMVLWLLAQADSKLKSQIAQYFRDPGIMHGGNTALTMSADKVSKPDLVGRETIVPGPKSSLSQLAAEAEQIQLEDEAAELRRAVKRVAQEDPSLDGLKDQVRIKVVASGLQIDVIDKGKAMLFDLASAELKPALVALLRRLGTMLGKLPNPVQVEGHTDARPFASRTRTNWDLSFERADRARRVMEENGLRRRQVQRVLAYADSSPAVPEDPLAAENRRLSIVALRRNPPPNLPRVEPATVPHAPSPAGPHEPAPEHVPAPAAAVHDAPHAAAPAHGH